MNFYLHFTESKLDSNKTNQIALKIDSLSGILTNLTGINNPARTQNDFIKL